MAYIPAAQEQSAVDSLQGDLLAIERLLALARHPAVPIPARKRLWNAHSRLVFGILKTLGITNPNSIEYRIARELVLRSAVTAWEVKLRETKA